MADPAARRWLVALGILGALFALVLAAVLMLSGSDEDGGDAPAQATATERPVAEEEVCDIRYPDGRCVDVDSEQRKDRGERRDPAPSEAAPAPRRKRQRLERAVGAKMMTGMRGTFPDAGLLGRIRRGEVGGVIIMGENVSPQLAEATRAMRRAARDGGGPGLLIATDQEGGEVRRLSTSPPTVDPATMGGQGRAAAEEQGRDTGRALRERGVNVDLAPVADVQRPGGFIGRRAFGTTPEGAARGACAFVAGLSQAGVGSTLKHFPGLGRATTNTDNARADIAVSREDLESDLAPYRRCGSESPLIMLSNAVYPGVADTGRPAVLSRAIVTDLLRGDLGYEGVTISDTLAAPSVAGPTTAIQATRAGVDMLLYIDPSLSEGAYRSVLAAARSGELPRSAIRASATRIHALQRDLRP